MSAGLPLISYVRNAAPWLLLLALVVGPAMGLGVIAWRVDATPAELQPEAIPVFTELTSRLSDGRITVSADFDFADPPALTAPAWTGLVTSVAVAPGEPILSGDVVLTVDRVARIAVASGMPFHRELSVGSHGEDVIALEELLVALGHLEGHPDRFFTGATAAGVSALQRAAGMSTPTGVFSPSLVIWMPHEPLTLGELHVVPGSPAPSAGMAVGRAEFSVASVRLTRGDGSPFRFEGTRTLEFAGQILGEITGGSDIPHELANAIWEAGSETHGGPRAHGTVGASLPVTLRLLDPIESWAAPSSAVMVGTDGTKACVWVEDEGALAPLDVLVVGGTLGVTDLRGPVEGRRVLVNPSDVLTDPSCP